MRADMVVGSPEWAKSTLDYAKSLWHSVENSEARWRAVVAELEKGRAWKPLGKRTLDELLVEEIGVTAKESIHQVTQRARAEGVPPIRGEIGRGRNRSDNIKPNKANGTSPDYLSRRLLRDAPEIFAALERGEYRSVYAAAKAAGIVKVPTPVRAALNAWAKLSSAERAEFWRLTESMDATVVAKARVGRSR
jgi:hypothetical protein